MSQSPNQNNPNFFYPRQQNPFQPNQQPGQIGNNYLDFQHNSLNQNQMIQTHNMRQQKVPNQKEIANKRMQSRNMIPGFSPAPVVHNTGGGIVPDRIQSHSSSQEF